MRIRRSLTITVTALAVAAAAAACGGTTSKIGSGTAVKGQPLKGGTVTVAQISGASPNDIFPLTPATNSNGYNLDLTEGEWPSLVYIGDGGQSVVNPKESLYSSLTWSDNDSVITIVLKPWKWSDGTPITARDFTFVYNLLKANYNDWIYYNPGPVPGRRDQRDDAEHEHRRHPPGPVLQPRFLHRRRAVLRAADAAARLGQDLADRHGRQLRRDHRRGQGGVELPAEAGLRHSHLRHQSALEGGGRAVEAGAVPERRLLRLGAEPQLLRPRQAGRVQGHLRPVHHRRRHDGHAALGNQPERGPAAAERRGPDRRAAAGGLRGRVGAHPGRRRDRAEPVQPGQRPAAAPALHPAGP